MYPLNASPPPTLVGNFWLCVPEKASSVETTDCPIVPVLPPSSPAAFVQCAVPCSQFSKNRKTFEPSAGGAPALVLP